MIEKEYYVVESATGCSSFAWGQKSGPYGMGKAVQDSNPVKLRIKGQFDSEPNWCDYHPMDGAVMSGRLKQALEPLDLYGVEFVPVEVSQPNPFSEPPEYWFAHIWNHISCLDLDNSDVERYQDGEIFSIEQLVLNKDILERLDPRKRQIFRLREKMSTILIHETVKEAIERIDATGIQLFPASEWYNDIIFE